MYYQDPEESTKQPPQYTTLMSLVISTIFSMAFGIWTFILASKDVLANTQKCSGYTVNISLAASSALEFMAMAVTLIGLIFLILQRKHNVSSTGSGSWALLLSQILNFIVFCIMIYISTVVFKQGCTEEYQQWTKQVRVLCIVYWVLQGISIVCCTLLVCCLTCCTMALAVLL
jgi:hypothetical protein